MDKQQQVQVTPTGTDQVAGGEPPPPARRTPGDDTWGQGASTALDSLRRQNFRGHRIDVLDERPKAE